MRTWNEYKEKIKKTDPAAGRDIEEMENIADIVLKMVEQRNALGITQRELAVMCGMPQSSVARIETMQITPNLDTLLRLLQPLGLKLVVAKETE